MPGLDGLRGVAIVGVVLYGVGFDWMPGGLLGASVFFTLSGYLITDLLLGEGMGGGELMRFWLARARRVLPALAVVVLAVMAWVAIVGPEQSSDLRGAAVSAGAYVNNWWLILRDSSYYAAFEAPGPLAHLWAISIEEQFYLLWPPILMVGVWLLPGIRRPSGARPQLAVAILVLAVLLTVLMASLYSPGEDASRVLFGSDTRAPELLLGAALAALWPSRALASASARRRRRWLDVVGFVGLAVMLAMMARVESYASLLYGGGFLLFALASTAVIASAADPTSRLGPVLGWKPLRWLGVRSYGIYLWHLPILVLTGPAGAADPSVLIACAQIAATIVIAAASWRFIEEPIRQGGLGRVWRRVREHEWAAQRTRIQALCAGAGIVVGAAIGGFAGAGILPAAPPVGELAVAQTLADDGDGPSPQFTSCDAVVHIGDSTSEGLVSDRYLSRRDQVGFRYRAAGVTEGHLEVVGPLSISENPEGGPTALEIAERWRERGFEGCWMLALGTNEAANVAAGSDVGFEERIDSMMATIGDAPVIWTTTRSLRDSGPYADTNMARWNAAVLEACEAHPGMRVLDWASAAREEWFAADGIQLTAEGHAARSRMLAGALSAGFPAYGETDSACVITPEDARASEVPVGDAPLTVAFAGDITPGSRYGLPPREARSMFEAVRAPISEADLAIGNLEGTLSEGGISKCPVEGGACFSFQAPPENAEGLRWAGFDLLNLANNHAYDFGEEGMAQTIDALRAERLAFTGPPGRITELAIGGASVAVVGFAPYEWANRLDELDAVGALIAEARTRAPIVIAVAHLGAEGADYQHVPEGIEYAFGEDRGDTRGFAHTAIDAGASMVLASGPHVLRGMELYRGRLIAYSLGNFAGWENFSTGGTLSESALLSARLSASGTLRHGQITPLQLVGPGIPQPDSGGAAITSINALSAEDFGEDAVTLAEDGRFEP